MQLSLVLTLLPREREEKQTQDCSGLHRLCTRHTQYHFVGASLITLRVDF